MVTRPNTMTGGGTSVGTSSAGDGGGCTEEKDKISGKDIFLFFKLIARDQNMEMKALSGQVCIADIDRWW